MTTIHNHLLPLTTWTVDDSNVLKKLRLQKEKRNPTPTEIRQNLGPRLAEAVFSNLLPTTKSLIGLGKELDGPGDNLWTQPNRQLLGEIILEPFPTRRLNQSLTHQSILELGEKSMIEWENKVIAQKELEMKEIIRKAFEEMNSLMEIKINQIRTKERENFLIRIAMMEERLEQRHKIEMEALERKLTEEKEAKINEVMALMNTSHEHETGLLLDASKTLLTSRFHFKINWIRADLEEDFQNKIRAETKLIELRLMKEYYSKQADDLDLNTQELQNAVCTACLTADFMLNDFRQKLESLKSEAEDLLDCNMRLANDIERLEGENSSFAAEVKAWECVAKELVFQFQKFIEFHLKLPPGEGTHLISWDKILNLKNRIYNKNMAIKKPEKEKTSTMPSLSSKITQLIESTSISSGICENKDVMSIISSIIRRVIPSLPDVADAGGEVNKIIEHLIKQVIPSSSTLLLPSEKEPSPIIPINFGPCQKYQRSQYETKGNNIFENQSDEIQPENLEEQLETRVTEIQKVMGQHPNILKFIQGA